MEGIHDDSKTEHDFPWKSMSKPGPHASVADATRKANAESSYYVDPNTHQSPESGAQEPVDKGHAGDKMVGEDTGGQDHFKAGG